ncbi:hypothetical protein [Geodermatophilus sp. URMC 63]
MAEVQDWAAGLEEVHRRIAGAFARAEPQARVLTYLRGLLGQSERNEPGTATLPQPSVATSRSRRGSP